MHAQSHSATELSIVQKLLVRQVKMDTIHDAVFPDHIKQRCTQQIVQESETIANCSELESAINLYNALNKKIITLRKWTRVCHSPKSKRSYVTKLQKWLRDIISRYKKSRYEIMKKFGTTLENAAPKLFAFVLYPFVHSTTNIRGQ